MSNELKAKNLLCSPLITRHSPEHLAGAPLSSVMFELVVLVLMGVVLIPAGLWVFGRVERWAKHTGKLKRTG